MNKRQRAFTLIELLVVVAIIGILSSITLSNLNSSRQKSRDVKRIADIKQLQLALELYFDINRTYPGQLLSDGSTAGAELAPTYIPSIPTPPSGVSGVTAYTYVPLNSGCNGYHLGAALELPSSNVLTNDSDFVVGSVPTSGCGVTGTTQSSASDFDGTGIVCNGTSGSPQPGGTEQCFDTTP